jgi:hypothetical protein
MQLHSLIPDNQLPDVLKKPLVFGDKEQISALYDLGTKISEMEAEQVKITDRTIKYYKVEISYVGTYEANVLAKNESGAKEKAREDASSENIDIEEDFIDIREIKNREGL